VRGRPLGSGPRTSAHARQLARRRLTHVFVGAARRRGFISLVLASSFPRRLRLRRLAGLIARLVGRGAIATTSFVRLTRSRTFDLCAEALGNLSPLLVNLLIGNKKARNSSSISTLSVTSTHGRRMQKKSTVIGGGSQFAS
jgi:hypothetical protein